MSAPGESEAGRERFFADSMLGKLALWMRILGFDVEYERDIDDDVLIRRALSGGRTVLTRDRLLMKKRVLRGRAFFVTSDHPEEQLREVAKRFPPDAGRFLSRCLRCNAVLAGAEKESVRDKVPPYVYETQESFSGCPSCGRVYWAGTHRDEMVKALLSSGIKAT